MAPASRGAKAVAVAGSLVLLGLLVAFFFAGREIDEEVEGRMSLLRDLLENSTAHPASSSRHVAPAVPVSANASDRPPARFLSGVRLTDRHGPDFRIDTNPNYKVFFDDRAAPVVQNRCQGTRCRNRGANNIASVTMQEAGDSFVPVRVVVKKLQYTPGNDGIGWNIRPSHLQEEGVIKDVDSSSIETSGSISFTLTAPCQVSVELGSEEMMFKTKTRYWSFSNLIIAANPPESAWPQQKPEVIEDSEIGALTCKSARANRACMIGYADNSCDLWQVPQNTDVYFTSRVSQTYRWKGGCGDWTKKIRLMKGASLFLDEDVVIHAMIQSGGVRTGLFGYGVISNFYYHGRRHSAVASPAPDPDRPQNKAKDNLVGLGTRSTVFGAIVMDSSRRNIRVGKHSTVAWTKSFAWESQTDAVNLGGSHCNVHNNFFKVNDDVIKAYRTFTTFSDNVVWHQTIGRALMLSWGNRGENLVDRNGSTRVMRTSIIHDYAAVFKYSFNGKNDPNNIRRLKSLVWWGSLISAQHSMPNALGDAGSRILIKDLHVEGVVGVLMAMTTGFKQLGGDRAWWQAASGCGGGIYVEFDNLDLRRVRRLGYDSAVGGCEADFSDDGIPNAQCLCTTDRNCRAKSQCQLSLDFKNLKDPESDEVPKLADIVHVGANAEVQGLTDEEVI